MHKLNFPEYQFKVKNSENKRLIFDKIRKKYMVLTPEEWVRQHVISYLLVEKKYPISLVAVEKQLELNKLKKRFDVLVFQSNGKPNIIVECKAPNVNITQETFDQIARYNMSLNADYLMVTNGMQHYYCQMDKVKKAYRFLEELPNFSK